jgi:RNA polymerase sigma factor (sigma-70 family)
MRQWLLKFVRKLLPTQGLRQPLSRPGRPADFLRLELLEDRLIPSAVSDEVSSVVYASLSDGVSLSPAGATITLVEGSVSTTGLSGPGLDRLIEALQQLTRSSAEFVTQPTGVPATSNTGTPEGDTGGETTNDVSGNGGVPTLPATPQTVVVVSAGTSTATDSGAVGSVSVDTSQGVSGRVEDVVTAASTSFDPIVVETYQPAITVGALSGPGALQALQPAFPDGWRTPGASGAAPAVDPEVSLSVTPGGTSAASPQAPPSQGVDVTTNPLATPGTDVASCPAQRFPDANGGGTWIPLADLSDGSLLQSFAANREQSAFTTLVQRHEPSVLRVCTQVLGDSDRARDASQATFLVLARLAGSLDGQAPLGGWLSTVAYHLALRYRANDVRRRQLERAAVARSAAEDVLDPAADLEKEEVRAVVGEELNQLPAKYRVPLILHYIDGRTHADVAREIGLPLGSIARRIEDALGRLRDRLITRGFPF